MWGESEALAAVDTGLWAVAPSDFVPHCVSGSPASLEQRSQVLLATVLDTAAVQQAVLVNLHPELPSGYEAFERVIEVVSAGGDDRDSARTKWRQYTAAGHTIVRHDLQLKEASA